MTAIFFVVINMMGEREREPVPLKKSKKEYRMGKESCKDVIFLYLVLVYSSERFFLNYTGYATIRDF
ncbi:MAG: hypothetical protein KAW93_05945 [Methanogenium sp.]|nr:hypothetical protein [Methanogenium sp.]